MKTLIITINDNILSGLQANACGQFLTAKLFNKDAEIVGNKVISNNENTIINTLNEIDQSINSVIIFGEYDSTKNLQVKRQIAKFLKDELKVNNKAKEIIANYYNDNNLSFEKTSQNEALIPSNSSLIENSISIHQGFAIYDSGKHIIFLPNHLSSVKNIYNNWLLDYLKAKFPKLSSTFTIKTFGLTKAKVLELLDDLLNNNQIKILIYPNNLELTIVIKYSALLSKSDINAFVENITDRLKDFVYATEDASLYEIAYSLLKRTNTRLAIAESITGGNIISNLIKANEGISKYLSEGIICYTSDSKVNRLRVAPSIIDEFSAVSVETVYEMATGLLETNDGINMALSTVGYASNNGKENGLVFTAVGDYDGIHVYKNKFKGTREEVIEMSTKAAVFYLIKKIKENIKSIEQMFDK